MEPACHVILINLIGPSGYAAGLQSVDRTSLEAQPVCHHLVSKCNKDDPPLPEL